MQICSNKAIDAADRTARGCACPALRRASTDQRAPSGKNILQNKRSPSKRSPPLTSGRIRVWSEIKKNHERIVARRVQNPTSKASAITAAIKKSASSNPEHPPNKCNEKYHRR